VTRVLGSSTFTISSDGTMKFAPFLAATCIALAFPTIDAAAAQFVVQNTNDDGAGSLRQAIVAANARMRTVRAPT
jgi:hypothetical protein